MYPRAKYSEPTDKKSWEDLSHPAGSPKLDGANFWLTINSEGKPSYISRRMGVSGNYPDRTSALPHLDFTVPELAGQVLNLELIHTGFNKNNVESHSTVSGILNSLPPRARETQGLIGPVRAGLINVLNPSFSTYAEKIEHLRKVEKLIGKPDLIFVPQTVKGHEAIKALLQKTKDRNQEGIIVTDLHKPDASFFKVKHKLTYNLVISQILQEVDKDGKPKESMGAVVVKDASGQEVGKVGTGFSRADRIDAWKNPSSWVGRLIQVGTVGWAARALRMPTYNGDADGDLDLVPK